jgi:apolipoprotein D and lipocalin family protein
MSDDGDLQQRVLEAEQRVIAHDEALRQRWMRARQHWQRRMQPRRWLTPAAVGGAVLVLAWWGLRRPRPAAAAFAPPPTRTGWDGARWVRTVGLLWPLLPTRWRARVSPGAAAAMAAVGLPLLEGLVATRTAPPLATAPQLDLARFMGTWHEVARLPVPYEKACVGAGSAHYKLHAGGVEVVNRCRTSRGGERVAVGRASVVAGSGNARWRVSFLPPLLDFLPFVWSDLSVVYVDPQYRMAVVGRSNRRACWLLARDPVLPAADKAHLVEIAAARGFPIRQLLHVDRLG